MEEENRSGRNTERDKRKRKEMRLKKEKRK